MDARYSIYFAGELLDGHDRATVRAGLAKLFNADEATLDKLFSGKAQMIKRGCDKATALKYKQAMERTGARPIIRDEASGETPAVEQPEPAKPVSAAEKIAALAAAPDEGAYRSDTSVATANAPEVPAADGSAMNLAPTGADVLRPDERTEVAEADIDTSSLVVDETAQRLSDEPPPPPPAPDTSHLGMGEVGDTIPGLDTGPAPVTPDTESISLAPEGTDFSDCTGPEPETPAVDLSSMELAPAGSDVLDEQYRKRQTPDAPDTDHISLEE
jgi:hypothetical protein